MLSLDFLGFQTLARLHPSLICILLTVISSEYWLNLPLPGHSGFEADCTCCCCLGGDVRFAPSCICVTSGGQKGRHPGFLFFRQLTSNELLHCCCQDLSSIHFSRYHTTAYYRIYLIAAQSRGVEIRNASEKMRRITALLGQSRQHPGRQAQQSKTSCPDGGSHRRRFSPLDPACGASLQTCSPIKNGTVIWTFFYGISRPRCRPAHRPLFRRQHLPREMCETVILAAA